MSVRYDNSIVNQILQANDIVEVVSEHLRLERKGKEMVGLCPFHDDSRPSLNVSPVKQIFKCFACGAGGNVFTFVQMRENLSFREAVERLAQRAGIKIKSFERTNISQDVAAGDLARVNSWALKFWQSNLQNSEKGRVVREYLQGRKISQESMEKWAVGFATDSWEELLAAAGAAKIGIKLIEQAGLAVRREGSEGYYDRFRNRLMFPIIDVTGRVIGFGGRAMGDDPAKYINSPTTVLFDKSNSLYGLNHARHEIVARGTAVVVEGYTDCIMAHQFGVGNVVATLGTSLTTGHARLLKRYANTVVLVFDNDVAGVAAANRALEICVTQGIDIKIALVEQGQDPCDFLLANGGQVFEDLIAGAVDVILYKWQKLDAQLSGSEAIADRRAAIEEFMRTVGIAVSAGNIDPIGRGILVNRLSRVVGLDSKEVNAELLRLGRRGGNTASYSRKNRGVVSADLGENYCDAAEREVLEVLLCAPELFGCVDGYISVESFETPQYRRIAAVLFESLRSTRKVNIAQLAAGLESVEIAGKIVELAEQGGHKGRFEERLNDAMAVLIERDRCRSKANGKGFDETDELRRFQEQLRKHNQRNVGML
ncbi:MAG: DNA primase [Planctomycetota bacterium]